ncbi:MAG: DUF4340 domain-containing protein [Anaerolineae bacterium]
MRLNFGTLILILIALVVIVGVVILTGQQASAPGEPTATPAAQSGSVFDGVDAAAANSLEIVNHQLGDFVTLTKDAGGAWDITGTRQSTVTPPDQAAVATNLNSVATLQYTDRFDSSDLAAFGLDQPVYRFVLTTETGGQYTLYVGGKNPAGNRYYAVAQSVAGEGTVEPAAETTTEAVEATAEVLGPVEATAEVTAEATLVRYTGPRSELSGPQTILLINSSVLDPLIALISQPPYAPTPTPTATATATANPYSEVEQTATATTLFATQAAEAYATATALVATAEVTADAGAISTPEPTAAAAEVTAEATLEATAEVTQAP